MAGPGICTAGGVSVFGVGVARTRKVRGATLRSSSFGVVGIEMLDSFEGVPTRLGIAL